MKKAIPMGLAFLILVLCAAAAAPAVQSLAGEVRGAVSAAKDEASGENTPKTDEEKAAEILAAMSPEEKVWQMIVALPQDVCGACSCGDAETWTAALENFPVGGFVISGENMVSEPELRAMLSVIKSSAALAPFICVDEEGGAVARLRYNLGVTTGFRPMFTYRAEGAATARANAFTIGSEISAFGFNTDFAPVADVWTNPENTVIGQRAYSSNPREAAKLVAAAVSGFSDGGVISTLKHFPGHGDTAQDSHFSAAASSKSLEELFGCELLPFMAGIEAGAGMIMTGHITMTHIDPDNPATLSPILINGLLRETLGFEGVVITDSFRMEAISALSGSEGEKAAAAIMAGCDIILGPADPSAAAEAILKTVPAERIDESVFRILLLKIKSGIIAG